MASDQQRRERVANGSRRQRDLAVVGAGPKLDFPTFAAQHFPDESEGYVVAAAFHVYARNHKRKPPTVAEVRTRLEEKGWTREQLQGGSK